jgi:AcrR family transcriptional regulator
MMSSAEKPADAPAPAPSDSLGGAIDAIMAAVEQEEGTMTDKKRRIVEAAIHCFAENGYAATATNTIARRAGVAEGTIFRHFETKKDLLVRLVRPLFSRSLLPLVAEELRVENERANGDLRKFMCAILSNRLAFADRFAPLVRILIQEMRFHAELREAVAESFPAALQQAADMVLKPYIAAGQIREVEPAFFLRSVISLLVGYYVIRTEVLPAQEWDDAAEIARIVDLMLDGLRPR